MMTSYHSPLEASATEMNLEIQFQTCLQKVGFTFTSRLNGEVVG